MRVGVGQLGPVRDAAGRIAGVVTSLSDITSRRARRSAWWRASVIRTLADGSRRCGGSPPRWQPKRRPALFVQVTEEVGRRLKHPACGSCATSRTGTPRSSAAGPRTATASVGSSVPVDGETVLARVRRSGRVERIEGYEGIGGELAERLRARGYRASVAAPVRVAGRVWGALVASAHDSHDLDEAAERRLCDVAELVAQALANADAREMLAASRALSSRPVTPSAAWSATFTTGASSAWWRWWCRRLIRAAVDGDQGPRSALDSAISELREALEELRELACWHPPCRADQRRPRAGRRRAGRPLAVQVEIAAIPEERLPAPVEAAAYYIIAEAITNVAKYAAASRITVVDQMADCTRVEVTDNGVGGATPPPVRGLRGIADRVEALNGRLQVMSPVGWAPRCARAPADG